MLPQYSILGPANACLKKKIVYHRKITVFTEIKRYV